MKKVVIASFAFATLLSCSNSGNNKSGDKGTTDSGYNDIRGVENPNGNIPDTTATGATPHSDHPPVDSSRLKDSGAASRHK